MEPKVLDPPDEGTAAQNSAADANGRARNGAASPGAEPPELLAELAEIRRLLEAGAVPAAERLARELPARWPDSRRAAKVAEILTPAKAWISSKKPTDRNREREFAWLRAHAAEYAGNWLAVFEDRLLAVAPELRTVLDLLKTLPDGDKALLHHQPKSMSWP